MPCPDRIRPFYNRREKKCYFEYNFYFFRNYMVRGVVSACFAALQDVYWSGKYTVINPGVFLVGFLLVFIHGLKNLCLENLP